MALTPYQRAQLDARAAAGSLSAAAARRVAASVERMAARLAAELGALPAGTPAAQRRALREALRLTRTAYQRLADEIAINVAGRRDLVYHQVWSVWARATAEVAALSEVIPAAAVGAVRTPNMMMAGAYEALGGASRTWRTALVEHVAAGRDEVEDILRHGITAGVTPRELARRLRPYVAGAEEFAAAFPKSDDRFAALHDHQVLPRQLRGSARKVRSNATRIAYSELHNARAESELAAFAEDPLVYAVRWQLSPFRGQMDGPDECDVYATTDFYGLGPGVYPLDRVPLPPHPYDRCERVPVERPPAEWSAPKPLDLKVRVDPMKVVVTPPRGKPFTAAQLQQLRERVARNLSALEELGTPETLRAVVRNAEAQARELAGGVEASRERSVDRSRRARPARRGVPFPLPVRRSRRA